MSPPPDAYRRPVPPPPEPGLDRLLAELQRVTLALRALEQQQARLVRDLARVAEEARAARREVATLAARLTRSTP